MAAAVEFKGLLASRTKTPAQWLCDSSVLWHSRSTSVLAALTNAGAVATVPLATLGPGSAGIRLVSSMLTHIMLPVQACKRGCAEMPSSLMY